MQEKQVVAAQNERRQRHGRQQRCAARRQAKQQKWSKANQLPLR
jgi:hypothetical protein